MASDNASCPSTPTSGQGVVRAASGFGIAEVTAELAIDGRGTSGLGVVSAGGDDYRFDIQIPGDIAQGENVNATVRVTARDQAGRTTTISTTFTITRCQPPPTPTPQGLALGWIQRPPASMARDNFYCPDLASQAVAVIRATSGAGIDNVRASLDFAQRDDNEETKPIELPVEPQTGGRYAATIDLTDPQFGNKNGTGTLTVFATDKKGSRKQLDAAIAIEDCVLTVTWQTLPGSRVTASNALCPAVPTSTQGIVSVSVPGVVSDSDVTASITGSGSFRGTVPVTPLGSGQYRITLDPGTAGFSYTGQATIAVRIVDQRSQVYTLSSPVEIADCTLRFRWSKLPDDVVAGSNALCTTTPERTDATIIASLPDAVSQVSAQISIPPTGTSFSLPVRSLEGGRYSIDIIAELLPPVNSPSNTILFSATDIAGGSYELTTPISIVDCRGRLTWINPPPAQLALTQCVSVPAVGYTASFQAEVPARVPSGSVTTEGRNLTRGGVSIYSVSSTATGQFEFVISAIPAGTEVGDILSIRAFAPDHRETPFVRTEIVACPDAPVIHGSIDTPPTDVPPATLLPPTTSASSPSPATAESGAASQALLELALATDAPTAIPSEETVEPSVEPATAVTPPETTPDSG
jgi:hypothetical protein